MKVFDKGTGVSLLFIHGFPLNSGAWEKQLTLFSNEFRVIAPDLRGFGGTKASGEKTSMTEFADDLNELLTKLKVPSAILIGHSMGGYVALNFATRYPARTRGLVLVSTKAGPDSPETVTKREENAVKALNGEGQAIVDDMAAKMLSTKSEVGGVAAAKKAMEPIQPQGMANALRGMAVRPDSAPLLLTLEVPTLIITGDADALIPAEESKKMALQIPKAELSVISGAGHLIALEKPIEFNAVLKKWLARFL